MGKHHHPKVGEKLWIGCRATPDCPGKYAILLRSHELPEGGTTFRYRCDTCKRQFGITS